MEKETVCVNRPFCLLCNSKEPRNGLRYPLIISQKIFNILSETFTYSYIDSRKFHENWRWIELIPVGYLKGCSYVCHLVELNCCNFMEVPRIRDWYQPYLLHTCGYWIISEICQLDINCEYLKTWRRGGKEYSGLRNADAWFACFQTAFFYV